jgi:heptose-I-phosphate ethanolaminephosphotransferase
LSSATPCGNMRRSSMLLLRDAVIRSAATVFGLALFWQLGMQDLHDFSKSATFSVIANLGLVGLLLVQPYRWVGVGAAFLLNSLVLVTGAVEGFLFLLYGLTPKHMIVVDAILGTNVNEAREFIVAYGLQLMLTSALLMALLSLLYWTERKLEMPVDARPARLVRPGRHSRWTGGSMLVVFCLLHLNPTLAKENPLVYWPRYISDYHKTQEFMHRTRTQVHLNLKQAEKKQVAYSGPSEQTLVLVIGESVNRASWSLYGYPRKTTPHLDMLRPQMLVFKDVLSADATTAQSMLKMLTPATTEHPEAWTSGPNVLALARAAGYKVYWLSNQEQCDGPIQILAEYAHEQVFVNNGRGRETRSLDERLIPHLERVLATPDPRKIIVVHMQGAHLRYDLRYPDAFDRFSDMEDEVSRSMKAAGRSQAIRQARNEYDNAMLYGDHILSQILFKSQRLVPERPTSVLFVSDHGQEVGHNRDFAGHSSMDLSGYQIPMLLWTNRIDKVNPELRSSLEGRPYRTDRLDHTLLGLLDIRTEGYRAEDDILSKTFRFKKQIAVPPS